ncbi:hypothetical protein C8Q80DRAFT_149185 [Daedaleopsis nitida]|nr:hypothetical protein C8Q80DRAFT_149185 [Daedaleopsis nitida]
MRRLPPTCNHPLADQLFETPPEIRDPFPPYHTTRRDHTRHGHHNTAHLGRPSLPRAPHLSLCVDYACPLQATRTAVPLGRLRPRQRAQRYAIPPRELIPREPSRRVRPFDRAASCFFAAQGAPEEELAKPARHLLQRRCCFFKSGAVPDRICLGHGKLSQTRSRTNIMNYVLSLVPSYCVVSAYGFLGCSMGLCVVCQSSACGWAVSRMYAYELMPSVLVSTDHMELPPALFNEILSVRYTYYHTEKPSHMHGEP